MCASDASKTTRVILQAIACRCKKVCSADVDRPLTSGFYLVKFGGFIILGIKLLQRFHLTCRGEIAASRVANKQGSV